MIFAFAQTSAEKTCKLYAEKRKTVSHEKAARITQRRRHIRLDRGDIRWHTTAGRCSRRDVNPPRASLQPDLKGSRQPKRPDCSLLHHRAAVPYESLPSLLQSEAIARLSG